MSDKARTYFVIYLCLCALGGGIVVYLATSKQGPGVSTDAAVMLSTAGNLAKGHGLITYGGQQLTQFAPLYSVLVGLASLVFRQDVFTCGWALGILSFSALIWFGGLYFYQAFPEERCLAYFSTFVLFSSASLVQIFANIASDPLFLLIVVLFLMRMTAYLRSGSRRDLILAGALAIIGCFQRYAGLALAITGACIVAYHHRDGVRQALWQGASFAALTAAPILVWGYFHNLAASGFAFGGRQPSLPLLNLTTGLEKILYWFIPLGVILKAGAIPLFAVLLGAGILALFLTHSTAQLKRFTLPEALPSLAFTVVYAAVLIFDISSNELKGIDTDRVHVILLPSVLILGFTALTPILLAAKKRMRPTVYYGALVALFLVWSAFPLSRTYGYVRSSMLHGDISAYNSVNKGDIRSSALAHFLRTLDLRQSRLYSNGADSAWFILESQIDAMPSLPAEDRAAYLKAQYGQWPGAGQQGYLIWFYSEAHKPSYARPEELISVADVKEIYADAEGAVYMVSAP